MSANRGFERLHQRKDIRCVFQNGRRLRRSSFDLIFLKMEGQPLRIGVIVPLLGRGSVARNRVKRRVKEGLMRLETTRQIQGNLIIRAKSPLYDLEYREIVEELRRGLDALVS